MIVVLSFCLMAAMASLTQAQGLNPISLSLAVGPIGGVTIPQGDFGDVYNSGLHMGGMAWLAFGQFGVRGELTYAKMETGDGALGPTKIEGDLKQTGFLVSGTYAPLPTPLVKPYGLFGVGSYKVKASLSEDSGVTPLSGESTGFALAVGVGARLDIGKLGLMLEGRYMRISTEGEATKSTMISGGILLALI